MTADDIKRLLYCQVGKHWKVRLAGDELLANYDFLVLAYPDKLIEIEIKVDKRDLMVNELKKRKWQWYFNGHGKQSVIEGMPNYFYFCITEELWYECGKFIINTWKFAGIMIAHEDRLEIKEKPKRRNYRKLNKEEFASIARHLYLKYKRTVK